MSSLESYYILYFDVMGYCNKITRDEIGFLKNIKNLFLRSTEKEWDIVIRTFSDNIMACVKTSSTNGLKFLCHYAARIQELMLRTNELLLRGAITKGSLYFDKKFVFGKGLVRAAKLEEKVAKYPRIIIDETLNNENYIKNSQYTLLTDKDSYKYINFLNYYNPNINLNGERNKNWVRLKESIKNCISDLNKPDCIEKKDWLMNYYDKIKEKYNLQ